MIAKSFSSLVKKLTKEDLKFYQGLEKEGLRVKSDLSFSLLAHQHQLGHKLTHSYITTDYGENLLEFITPVFNDVDHLLGFLNDLQKYTNEVIDDEVIWNGSFPAKIKNEKDIPIADYGKSFSGRLKTLYREGLAQRYGKSMQSIAGLHYNFSFSNSFIQTLFSFENQEQYKDIQDFQSQLYFKVIRNYRRYSWLLSYLFGASPLVDESFLVGKEHNLDKINETTFGLEYATSLRMGGLGYTSQAQVDISLCYNELESYVSTLEKARLTSYAPYEKIGLKDDKGDLKQLNTNLLQIDNEFYTRVRPKRVATRCESALLALERRGVEYIEIRLLDLNPFEVAGIDKKTIEFLQIFLLFCAIEESPQFGAKDCDESNQNYDLVVKQGLKPNLMLKKEGVDICFREYALEVFSKMHNLINENSQLHSFLSTMEHQKKKVEDSSLLFSSKMLSLAKEGVSYLEMIEELSLKHKKFLKEKDYSYLSKKELEQEAAESRRKEEELVLENEGSFQDYLKSYFENIKISSKV